MTNDRIRNRKSVWTPTCSTTPVQAGSIVDARLNGSALVRPMDGMLPDDYVDAQFAERPDIDVVASGLAPAARA
jgi:hypothetical protein